MLGQTLRLADNLWFIQGDMPARANRAPDWCNIVVYRAGDRLYLIDSGGGAAMRAGIRAVLREVGPVESATLINTHAHLDHICNNDVLAEVPAQARHHYLLAAGMTDAALDGPRYFAREFDRIDAYADPFTSYQANRAVYRLAAGIRDGLGLLVGRQRVLAWLFGLQFRKFRPAGISRATMQALDAVPAQPLTIAAVPWRGWVLGPDDVLVLEARAHTDHDVLVFLPEHHMLCMGDVTFPLFPTWGDSNRDRILECLRAAAAMARSGQVDLLADGHGERCYRGQSEVTALLDTVLADHLAFEDLLTGILADADGLTAAQIYSAVRRHADRPVVAKYLALEFPHSPPSLRNVIVTTLLQMGYQARGLRRHRTFHRPALPQNPPLSARAAPVLYLG